MAKSRWHGALRSAHKSCTHGHVFWKRGGVKRKLVADPWTSSRRFSLVLWLRVHSHLLLRACLHLKLVRSDLDFLLWSAIQGACSSLALCTSVVRVFFQALEPTAFLVHPVLAAIAEDVLLPTPVRQMAHGNSPELCRRSSPVPQIMIFVFPAFTLSPFFSIASFQVRSLQTHSSSDSAMITRSSAYRSSQGIPERNSRDKASSTMMESSGLSTDPWWTPTFTSNSSLYPSPTWTWLCAFAYITCTSRTIQVFLAPTRWPSEVLDQTPSPGLRKPCRVSYWQLDTSLAAVWQQSSASVRDEAKLGIVDWHQLSDEAVHNHLQDFHNLLC